MYAPSVHCALIFSVSTHSAFINSIFTHNALLSELIPYVLSQWLSNSPLKRVFDS